MELAPGLLCGWAVLGAVGHVTVGVELDSLDVVDDDVGITAGELMDRIGHGERVFDAPGVGHRHCLLPIWDFGRKQIPPVGNTDHQRQIPGDVLYVLVSTEV